MFSRREIGSIIDLGQFKKGLNTNDDFDTLTLEETPCCMDVIFSHDAFLQKRNGRQKLNSNATGASDVGYGLFDFGVSPGTRKLIGKFGSTVYKMDDLDGTWDSLLTSNGLCNMHCAQSRNNLIICREDVGDIYLWDGSTASAESISSEAPQGKYPIDWEGYLFIGYIKDNPRQFYYEDNTTIDTGSWEDSWTIRTSRADEFTGWGLLKNRLYAFMRNSIHRISYLGGTPLWDVNELITITGAVPRTIKNIVLPNGEEVLIFLNWQKKIVIFNGTYIQYLSDGIQSSNDLSPVYLDGINDTSLKDCHAVVDTKREWYILHIPMTSSATINYSVVLDYKNMALFPFSNQTLHSSVYAEDSIGRQFLIASGYNGRAYYLLKENTDDGDAINEYYISSKLGAQRVSSLKKAEQISFYFQPVANYSLTFKERSNFEISWRTRCTMPMYNKNDYFLGETFVLGTSTLGSNREKVINTISLPNTNNLYQFQITSNSSIKAPWKLHKIEFLEKEMGIGRRYEN